ncbi:transposase [Staphylococcus sp. 17KM0847]|nr:transposase [Staphylococcus sp. 17KM0847]QLK85577.1 transposase [Staphylococcus sp. 17KM0847]
MNALIACLTYDVAESHNVLSDQMVYIGTPQNRSENPYRLLKVYDHSGKLFLIITTRFDLSPEEIADIYQSRWAIELFFKWVKQHVNIKKFYGHSQTAVTNQVYITLIVYCLNVLMKLKTNSQKTLLQIVRLLKAVIWEDPKNWLKNIKETVP